MKFHAKVAVPLLLGLLRGPDTAFAKVAQLSISANPDPAVQKSESVAAGSTHSKLESFLLKNPTSEAVLITQFWIGASNSLQTSKHGFTPQNMKATVNGSLYANGQKSGFDPTNYLVLFAGKPLLIPPGGQIAIDLYGDIGASTAAGAAGNIALLTCSGDDQRMNYCQDPPPKLLLIVSK